MITQKRIKINFMIGEELAAKLQSLIPAGERSDFVNEALDEAVRKYKMGVAFKAMDRFAKKHKLRMSDKEIIKLKDYGRK